MYWCYFVSGCPGLLFELLVETLDVAVAFVLAVRHAVVTVSVGLFRRGPASPQTRADQLDYPVRAVADQKQGRPQDGGDVQQEVLVDGDAVDGRAQVLGAAVTQDVADPVHGARHRVAWLIFVDLGQLQGFLAVPGRTRGGEKSERADPDTTEARTTATPQCVRAGR